MRLQPEVGLDWIAVKISPDTNVFLRVMVRDDENQALIAETVLAGASLIVVSLTVLCEIVWALRSVYRYNRADTILAIEAIVRPEKVEFDEPAVQAGLSFLAAGGDFADGVVAHQGRQMGGEVFVSFDRKPVAILQSNGYSAKLIGQKSSTALPPS